MSAIEVPKSEQAKQGEALMADIVTRLEKFGASFNDLDAKMQKEFKAHAEQIAKLSDAVGDGAADKRARFLAAVNADARGDLYRGDGRRRAGFFPHRAQAEAFGRTVIALMTGPGRLHDAREFEACNKWLKAHAGGEVLGGKLRFEQADAAAPGDAWANPLQIAGWQKAAGALSQGQLGGFLHPEQWINELIYSVEQYGDFEANCPATPVAGDSATQPKFTQGATIYYPDEGQAPTESAVKFGQVKPSLTRYSAFVLYDRWMLKSVLAVALGEFLAREMTRVLAQAQDTNGFVGDGSPTYAKTKGAFKRAGTAQLVVNGASGITTFQKIIDENVDYLTQMFGKLPKWVFQANPKFFGHMSIFWAYMGARDSQKRPLTNIMTDNGTATARLMGYPYVWAQACPKLSDTAVSTVMQIFGALDRSFILARHTAGMELRVSEEYKFLEGQVATVLDVVQGIEEKDVNGYVQVKTAAS